MRRALFAVMTTVLLAGLLVWAPAASAVDGGTITIKAEPGPPVTYTGGPMAVNDSGGVFHEPEDCRALPYCTTIDLEVLLPEGYDEDIDEFYIDVTLNWDNKSVADQAEGNDLDMYIYDVSGKEDDDPEDGEADPREVSRSATASAPEVAKLFQPDNGAYAIVIHNYIGVNLEFELKLEFFSAAVINPDEYYPTAPEGPKLAAGEDNAEAGSDFIEPEIDDDFDSALPELPAGEGEPALSGDKDPFGGIFGDDEFAFDDEPAADAAALNSFTGRGRIAVGPPGPASGAAIVAWMVFAPLAFAASVGFFMWRRRPAALAMDFRAAT